MRLRTGSFNTNDKPALSQQETADYDSRETLALVENTDCSGHSSVAPGEYAAGRGRKPPKKPWRNTEVTLESQEMERMALKVFSKTPRCSEGDYSERHSSVGNKRYARTPERRKVSVNEDNSLYLLNEEPTPKREANNTGTYMLAVNREVEMKHSLAQAIIELIGQNEKILTESDSRLNSYLNKSFNTEPPSCTGLVDFLRKQWVQRLKNLSSIFELIDKRREAALPQELLDTVYQTPRSLTKTYELN